MSKHYLRTTKNLYSDYVNGYQVYYSYNTAVGIRYPNNDLYLSENVWSTTTGRHLTWIDGGNKKGRLKREEFNQLVKQHKPEPNFIKSVSMVSAMFGLMCQNDIKTKNKYQKKFFDKVEGMNFPDDWNTLSEEEKSRRLEGATKIGLQK